ncbi:hypothetical protein GEV33_000297 [Tenebrio molitor]|uniref:Uncharacterized protein n=1 Tax=Tenebrio molitor TaxID=7067 RepID=A0A8J6HX75_TENMO|nr:hypothetical protein GEV33_000297 [Tenebrio molitor]
MATYLVAFSLEKGLLLGGVFVIRCSRNEGLPPRLESLTVAMGLRRNVSPSRYGTVRNLNPTKIRRYGAKPNQNLWDYRLPRRSKRKGKHGEADRGSAPKTVRFATPKMAPCDASQTKTKLNPNKTPLTNGVSNENAYESVITFPVESGDLTMPFVRKTKRYHVLLASDGNRLHRTAANWIGIPLSNVVNDENMQMCGNYLSVREWRINHDGRHGRSAHGAVVVVQPLPELFCQPVSGTMFFFTTPFIENLRGAKSLTLIFPRNKAFRSLYGQRIKDHISGGTTRALWIDSRRFVYLSLSVDRETHRWYSSVKCRVEKGKTQRKEIVRESKEITFRQVTKVKKNREKRKKKEKKMGLLSLFAFGDFGMPSLSCSLSSAYHLSLTRGTYINRLLIISLPKRRAV